MHGIVVLYMLKILVLQYVIFQYHQTDELRDSEPGLNLSISSDKTEDMVSSPDISQYIVSEAEDREDSNKEHMPRVSIPGIQCQYKTYKAIQEYSIYLF